MWMNQSEIEHVYSCRVGTPQYVVTACEFLYAFMNLINDISDGWAYWGYGTRCSNDLQNALAKVPFPYGDRPQADELRAARKKVCTFLRRCRQTKDNELVQEFLRAWDRKGAKKCQDSPPM